MVSADIGSTIVIEGENLISPAAGYNGIYNSGSGNFNGLSAIQITRDHNDRLIQKLDSTNPSNIPAVTPINYFIMRGKDPDCGSPTYRFWTVTGTPDLTGASYSGTRCGATPLTDIVIVRKYTQ